MKVEIKNRWTLAVQFTAEIPDDTPGYLRLGLAVKMAYKSGAVLRGAVLRDAVLRDAVLRGADLRGADLRDAVLRGAALRGADLRGADLRGAVLRGADLRDADLRGADLSDADLSDAVLRDADLSDADLRDADLRGAALRDADLRGAALRGADLRGADLRGAVLRGADLSGADLRAKIATPEQAIANLDKVREIILDNAELLEMGHWHQTDEWVNRTCAEEAVCGTTHCLAGWLQVCSTDPEVKKLEPNLAGIVCAPVAAKMFFRENDEVMTWLKDRAYVAESAARE